VNFVFDDSFRPPPWLRNCHVQSILPSLPPRRASVLRRAAPLIAASRELLLDCGDEVRLLGFHASHAQRNRGSGSRLAVLLHGWEGSAESMYVLSLGQELFNRGFEVVRLNLRDHGGTHHLNREIFHSCRLPEVVGAVRAIQARFPGKRLYLGGFSLGGNFMMRVAAEAANAGLDIAKAVAVCPVLDPSETLTALEEGFFAYHQYFVRLWSRSLVMKETAWPRDYNFAHLRRMANIRRMTAELVQQFTEFPSLEAYLNGYAITGSRLARLAVPATIITAVDDPIIPATGLERLARPAMLQLIVTRHGGHCGFLEGLDGPTWAERRAAAEMDEVADREPKGVHCVA
jgi:predicted alpha/beta-fold hydrolase